MPKGEDFSALKLRLANVKLDNLQDVTQSQASVKELESIRDEFDAKTKSVRETGAALSGEMSSFRDSYAELDKIAREDVRSLQAQMHLPSLDARTLSRAVRHGCAGKGSAGARLYGSGAQLYAGEKRKEKMSLRCVS